MILKNDQQIARSAISSRAMLLLHHLPTEQVLFHAKSQQMELAHKYYSDGNVDCSVNNVDITGKNASKSKGKIAIGISGGQAKEMLGDLAKLN